MMITPPEPTRRERLEDIDEHSKKYIEAKEELKWTLEAIVKEHDGDPEDIEEYFKDVETKRAAMKEAKEYLWFEYSIEEKNIQRVDFDECP